MSNVDETMTIVELAGAQNEANDDENSGTNAELPAADENEDPGAKADANSDGDKETKKEDATEEGDGDRRSLEKDEFEVERIIDVKAENGQLKFQVRWKGYGPEGDSWEPEEHLETARFALDEYMEGNATKLDRAKRSLNKKINSSKRGRPAREPRSRKAKSARMVDADDAESDRNEVINKDHKEVKGLIKVNGQGVRVLCVGGEGKRQLYSVQEAIAQDAMPLINYLLSRAEFAEP